MANHSLPTLTSSYTNFVTELDGRLDDLAVGLDPAVTTASNVPTNSVRWNSASNLWEKFNGTSWAALSTGYAIAITGNAGTATTLQNARTINGVSFNGSANISINLNTSLTFNNGGAGATSGSTFNGGTAVTVSHNTIGALALAGGTMTGKLNTVASATGNAGLNVPHGAAPTTPTNGDIWTTTAALLAQINGATKTVAFTDSSITGNATNVTGTVAVANGGTGATSAANALVNLGVRTSATGSTPLPSGTTAQRDSTPAAGYIRFNTSLSKFEGYTGSAWSSVGGGATGGGSDDVFIENSATVTTNYTITSGKNAVSAGPITINSGITVTVPSGSNWAIV